ncbi:type II secretion system protein M (GspM) [Noviherbaspirillum humi]|uniref:Type II secretion system protein M (GspM) n=1 Tax=Noviherbaspirillum humi TaxID=1688639 RepID=A0A239CDR6_9BURK|nr:type II secretion system protein GspM [Noviherbaspirillum humi]SNS18396.1 type II secretion system protein M (GspM) [Noviherbaspirillum humi]
MSLREQMQNAGQSWSGFWGERNPRERALLALAAAVAVFGLCYLLLIDPAISGRQNLEKKLPTLRQQAAEVQALAQEAGAVSDKAAAPVPALSRESLESSLTSRGLKPQNVVFNGDLARVQLSAASFAATVDWLDEMRRSARLSVVEATVEAQQEVDIVNATFTLRQVRGEQAAR